MRGGEAFFWMVWITMIGGGVVLILAAIFRRLKIIEMEHTERMAMIERGMMPPAHTGGPSATGQYHDRDPNVARSRMLSAGVGVIGLGIAFIVLIGIAAGEPSIALGVGGSIAVIGVAFVVISFFQPTPRRQSHPFPAPPPPPTAPPADKPYGGPGL